MAYEPPEFQPTAELYVDMHVVGCLVQVWRPLKGPVKSSPLGVIDVSTVDKEDLISYPLHFKDRVGYNYGVKHNPRHK